MKKIFIISILLLITLFSFGQNNYEDKFYNLKLKINGCIELMNKINIYDTIITKHSYLYFTPEGVSNTINHNIILYRFTDDRVLLEQKFDSSNVKIMKKYTIHATDMVFNEDCLVIVDFNLTSNKREVTISYKDYKFILSTEEIK
jgi:hypothetical protein